MKKLWLQKSRYSSKKNILNIIIFVLLFLFFTFSLFFCFHIPRATSNRRVILKAITYSLCIYLFKFNSERQGVFRCRNQTSSSMFHHLRFFSQSLWFNFEKWKVNGRNLKFFVADADFQGGPKNFSTERFQQNFWKFLEIFVNFCKFLKFFLEIFENF